MKPKKHECWKDVPGTPIWCESTQTWSWRGPITIDGVFHPKKQIDLNESSQPVAVEKVKQLLASGGPSPREVAAQIETLAQASRRIIVRQRAEGLVDAQLRKPQPGEVPEDACSRMRRLIKWVFPLCGQLRVDHVRPRHVREVLEAAVAAGKSKSTVDHIRDDMSTILGALWRDEVIAENPVARVSLPTNAKVDRRRRMIPTDSELAQVLASPDEPAELHVAIVCAREVGGQRTSDLLGGADWANIDTQGWRTWRVHRPKTDTWDVHNLPPLAARVLHAWWHQHGRPLAGPVFPVRRGPRQGQKKARGSTWSKMLQRALWRVGAHRWLPGHESATTEKERRSFDAMQTDTATTRRAEFHSLRRRFVTALRDADVGLQERMDLAGHTDQRTHRGYEEERVLTIPVRALPAFSLPRSLHGVLPEAIQTEATPSADVEQIEVSADGVSIVVASMKSGGNVHGLQESLRSPKLQVPGSIPGRRAGQHSVIVAGAPAPANETLPLRTFVTSSDEAWEADQHLQLILSLRAAALAQGFSRSRGAQ